MKQTLKKLIAIIVIISLFIPHFCYGAEAPEEGQTQEKEMTVEQARVQIANWALNFATGPEASKCVYSLNFDDRANTYNRVDPQSEYRFDCMGFVSYAINRAIGITYILAENGQSGFISCARVRDTEHFEEFLVKDTTLQLGDVLMCYINNGEVSHVGIYVGNNNIVDMFTNRGGGLKVRSIYKDGNGYRESSYTKCLFTKIGRLKSIDGAHFTPVEDGIELPEGGDDGGAITADEVDLDEIAEKFEYDGMPLEMTKQEDVPFFTWLFNSIAGFLDYLVGIMYSIYRVVAVGYINIFESTINNVIFKASMPDAGSEENTVEIYTIEDIIFNKIPLLDINFFSNEAGGQNIEENSAVDIIRNIVVIWYISFRNLVIAILAILIIYSGIRIALSTIPQDKAKYKQIIIGWIQALVIVFTIHFFMIIVINVNEELVGLIEQAHINYMTSQGWIEDTIYETIRTRAYDVRLSVGYPAMIMYLVLVIIWVKFLWVYFKRMFTILLLVVIAPFIGAKYAFDSAKGKKGSSLSSWMYDFVMNVLIQFVHVLVYTLLISTALNLSVQSIMGFVIALVFMNFMLKSDEIFRNIFHFDKSTLVKDTAKVQNRKEILEELGGAVFGVQLAKNTVGLAKWGSKVVTSTGKDVYKDVTKYNPNVKKSVNSKLDQIDSIIEEVFKPSNVKSTKPSLFRDAKNDFSNMMYYNAKIRRLSRRKGSMGIKAKKLKSKLKSQRKKRFTSQYKFIKDTSIAVGSLVLAVPITVVEPKVGSAVFTKGVTTLGKLPKKDNYKNEKKNIANRVLRKTGIYKVGYAKMEEKNKYTKKRDKIYTSIRDVEEINNREDKIKKDYEQVKINSNVDDNDINKFKQDTSRLVLEANQSKIGRLIDEYIKQNNVTSFDNSTLEDVIDNVVEQIGNNLQVDDITRGQIKGQVKSSIINQNSNNRQVDFKEQMNEYKANMTRAISDSFAEKSVDNRFSDVAKQVIALENTIRKAEKNAKTNYPHANKFLENLN